MLAFSFLSQVKLSEKLSHVQSLCIHEMIVRAFKHILQAVIASVVNRDDMAVVIATALNLMFGVSENEQSNQFSGVDSLLWRWLEVFLKKRYDWDLSSLNYKDVRKFAILRGLCHKVLDTSLTLAMTNILHYTSIYSHPSIKNLQVGIELVPRDFDMNSPKPFQKIDIVSLVPVHKVKKNKCYLIE